ncbi:MAG TPA: hypothetical protein DCP75_01220 [Haliea salexigens]|uniref:DUF86 domain-containing protein n=1 Tax=Haliea salexigens TaxID=287487 RepID=A0A3C1KI30_9GAMM|nr:hypothetical protein [Haliea sp.]HAN26359.1 hypothetical protein [Haliea salexigens]
MLGSDEFAGRVIKLAAVFESRLDLLLTEYFGAPERRYELYEHLITKLSLHQKTELLRNIDLGRTFKSRENLIASILSLRKLRNALAHNYHIREEEVEKLYSDQKIRKWVLEYPKALSSEKRNLEVRIDKLWKQIYPPGST